MAADSDNKSDYTKPRTNIYEFLPEVFKSEVNESVINQSFNRMLTKDQTSYITGYVGEGNPCAIIDRQIQEPTPFRQAFQLQPTANVKVGAVDYNFSQQSFYNQLEITGVDIDRLPLWGNALMFNWVPPINIDKLINYRNYYWVTKAGQISKPDYIVIENKCNVVASRTKAYKNTVISRGPTQDIINVNPAANTFTVEGYQQDLYVTGFVFYTRETTNVNYDKKFWTTVSSTFDQCANTTTIYVAEDIAIRSDTQPPGTSYQVGRWWYDTDDERLYQWTGTQWIQGTIRPSGVISLEELLDVFKAEENCVCYGDVGWDLKGWDDSQAEIFCEENVPYVVWNQQLLNAISHATEADWIAANGVPVQLLVGNIVSVNPGLNEWTLSGNYATSLVAGTKIIVYDNVDTPSNATYTVTTAINFGPTTVVTVIEPIPLTATPTGYAYTQSLWYDTTNDILYQRNQTNTGWTEIQNNFSVIINATTGKYSWDLSPCCITQQQIPNQWSTANQWTYRLSLESTSGAQSAKAPILEYDSTVELNKWTQVNYAWKYRKLNSGSFTSSSISPTRIELEPVKNFYVDSGIFYLGSNTLSNTFQNRDIDFTDIFVPGFTFRVRDNGSLYQLYTVQYSVFEEVAPNTFVTKVFVNESCVNTITSGGPTEVRIEPIKTSVGDNFIGYHVHWVLDVENTSQVPADNQPLNPVIKNVVENKVINFAVTNVNPFPANVWTIAGDHVSLFNVGQIINITGNTGGADGVYYVQSVALVGLDTEITVQQPIVVTATPDGTLQVYPRFTYQNVVPTQSGTYEVGLYYQKVIVADTSFTAVVLDPTLSTPNQNTPYALYQNDDIRVYIDGIRQYGTYTEQFYTFPAFPTFIGNAPSVGVDLNVVSGITFNTPVPSGSIVEIFVGSPALTSMSNYSIPVRTIQDEAIFAAAVTAGTQPAYVNLDQFRLTEQVKTTINQYPLFNIYDVSDNSFLTSSPIFGYREDSDQPIDLYLNKRVVKTDTGAYYFDQFILDSDNAALKAYRRTNTIVALYWYNVSAKQLKYWDGENWTDQIVYTTFAGSQVVITPFVGEQSQLPTYYSNIEGFLWYDTLNKKLFQWTYQAPSVYAWEEITGVYTNPTDPTLYTIWRHGKFYEQYVPEYVNADRQPVPVGDPEGAWELADQWYFNPEHHNKKYLSETDLFTHFTTIIDQQQQIPGIIGGGSFSLLQSEYNYGLGGTIKEFNDSYDTLISSMFVNNITPTGVIEFAQNQYASLFQQARETFRKRADQIFISEEPDSFINFEQHTAEKLINFFALNDVLAIVYGDSSAFNDTTDTGMRNWIATAPMFGLADKVVPYVIHDRARGQTQLIHHDGHRTDVDLTLAEIDQIGRLIITQNDPRVNRPYGVEAQVPPPQYESVFESSSNFGSPIRNGVYWLQTNTVHNIIGVIPGVGGYWTISGNHIRTFAPGVVFKVTGNAVNRSYTVVSSQYVAPNTRIYVQEIPIGSTATGQISMAVRWLYRFNVLAVQNVAPSLVYNGSPLPAGTKYYNTFTKTIYQVVTSPTLQWQPIGPLNTGDISAGWLFIDLDELYANSLLNIEQRLYDVTPNYDQLVFDFNSLTPTIEEQLVYDEYNKEQFYEYLNARDITNPFVSVYNSQNPFTWNYVNCIMTSYPTTDTTVLPKGCWQATYTQFYNTPYPHLEPWRLQGYADKPAWWDDEYRDLTLTRRWLPIMWTNVLAGIVPTGYTLPDGINVSTGVSGEVTQYNYVSVNITATDVTSSGIVYRPDDVYPPFLSNTTTGWSSTNRSLFSDFNTEIVGPNRDFVYGEQGFVEWRWLVSGQHVYDPLTIAFKMQPVRFMHYSFGEQFVEVDSLQIDTRNDKVFSHEDTIFHGDLYTETQTYEARGLNQWYVNFNRFYGYDTNAEFRTIWVDWNPLLTYLFGSIVDTSTLDVYSNNIDMTEQDYRTILAKELYLDNFWFEAFNVVVTGIPPILTQYNTQSQWKLSLNSLAPSSHPIEYYESKVYPVVVDPATDTFTLFKYDIVNSIGSTKTFTVNGNQTNVFTPGRTFTVTGTDSNNGFKTTVSSTYNPTPDTTTVQVVETVIDGSSQGFIDTEYVDMPYAVGDIVVLQSTKLLPAPLSDGFIVYAIPVNNKQFKVAYSQQEAQAGVWVDIKNKGSGLVTAGVIENNFSAQGLPQAVTNLWYNYQVDKTKIHTLNIPYEFSGIQTLINIINGYKYRQQDLGFVYSDSTGVEKDPTTGRLVSWQYELERFIYWAFQLRRRNLSVPDRYEFAVGTTPTQIMTLTGQNPSWTNGQKITLLTSGTLPEPLIGGVAYYYVRTNNPQEFKLSISPNISDPANIVTLTTTGSGILFVGVYNPQNNFPIFEINPLRNNIWVNTPRGIISNILAGNIEGTDVQQAVYDQYGRLLTVDLLKIYRQDKQSRLLMRQEVPNDLVPPRFSTGDPYNYIHMGSGHLFLEGYEHALLFDDYSINGCLIYDPFLGLNIANFDLQFFRTPDFNLRPNVGGYYLLNNQFYRNIEGSVVDTQYFYDTMQIREGTPAAIRSRAVIGYNGPQDYLKELNVTNKTDLLFYKGMIQSKGSRKSVEAYTNSKHYEDAVVDEVWAWKVAEYGDSRPKVYPEIKMYAEDGQLEDVRFQFLKNYQYDPESAFAQELDKYGFEVITETSTKRWADLPEQLTELGDHILFNDAELSSRTTFYASNDGIPPNEEARTTMGVDYWYDKTLTYTGSPLNVWDGTNWVAYSNQDLVVFHTSGSYTGYLYVQTQVNDDVECVKRVPLSPLDLRTYNTIVMQEGTLGSNQFVRVNSEVVRFEYSDFDGFISIFTVNVAKTRLNPAALLDTISNVKITDIPVWDPARGHYYHIAENNYDIESSEDPALYNTPINQNVVSQRAWNEQEVGTRWFDTSMVSYLPYYDDKVNPDVNQRLFNWGRLSDWGNVEVYQWIESPVLPSQWPNYVRQFANNLGIPQNDKPTGNPKQEIYRRDRTPYDAVIDIYNIVAISDSGQYFQITGNYVSRFYVGRIVEVKNTGAVNGTYQVLSATFASGVTTIYINTGYSVIPSGFSLTSGYQYAYLGAVPPGNTPLFNYTQTGLSPANTYNAMVTIDGGTPITMNIQGTPYNEQVASVNIGTNTWTISPLNSIITDYLVGTPITISGDTGGGNGVYTIAVVTPNGSNIDVQVIEPIPPLAAGDGTASIPHNYRKLIAQINSYLGSGATCSLSGGTLQIESNSTGSSSSILIQDMGPFPPCYFPLISSLGLTLDSPVAGQSPIVTQFGTIGEYDRIFLQTSPTTPQPFNLTDLMVFNCTDYPLYIDNTQQSQLATNTQYALLDIGTDASLPSTYWYIRLTNLDITPFTPFEFETPGSDIVVTRSFTNTEWVYYPQVHQKYIAALYPSLFVAPVFEVDSTKFYVGDTVNIYVNGKIQNDEPLTVEELTPGVLTVDATGVVTIKEFDFIEIVRQIPTFILEDDTDPDVFDDATVFTDYTIGYNYTASTKLVQGQEQPVYYFWVSGSTNKNLSKQNSLSAFETTLGLISIPIPYVVFQKPIIGDPAIAEQFGYGQIFGLIWDTPFIVPGENLRLFYSQTVIRRAASYLNDDDRYVVRFTRDLTYRDNLNDYPLKVNLKDKHTEWLLIREDQPTNIDRRLWDRLTESLMGYKLDNPNVLVPSLERVLYDETFGTDTQYGLGYGQTFVKKEYGLDTILTYLTDPNRTFNPIDIASFFDLYNFDTPENIREAMEVIYNNFPTKDVNGMFFQCLSDSFTTRKSKYKEIIKTSWVVLKGVKPFDINGELNE